MPARKYPCPVCAWDCDDPCEHFNICPCCGTEFGYDDAAPNKAGRIKDLRKAWIATGPVFWKSTEKPEGWSGDAQVVRLHSKKSL